MAAEVSSLRRLLNNGGDTAGAADHHQTGKQTTAMITRDFLGVGRSNLVDFKELDLDMHVPSGWEKRLDLKSGKVYVQKKESMIAASSKSSENKVNSSATAAATTKLQDLNFPPTIKTPKPPPSDDTAPLNLNLVLFPLSSSTATSPPPTAASSSSAFNSVCTLDKVKFALERAEREINNNTKQGGRRSVSTKRTSSSMSSPSRSSSSVLIDNSDIALKVEEEEDKRCRTFATGCPNCLIYVLVSRKDPKCPRCSSLVPDHAPPKKPRIDLNISL